MSASSSVRSSLLRRCVPYIPLVPYSNCGLVVKRYISGTDDHDDHDSWVFYKCKKHGSGCNFWHWELEYVEYLCEMDFLTGDEAINIHGWAEERREALELRNKEREVTRLGNDQLVMMKLVSMLDLLTEAVLLLKVVVGLLGVLCLMIIQKK